MGSSAIPGKTCLSIWFAATHRDGIRPKEIARQPLTMTPNREFTQGKSNRRQAKMKVGKNKQDFTAQTVRNP
jgi:hypothetical protein